MVDKLHSHPDISNTVTNFLPRLSGESIMPISIFLTYFFVQWWAHKYTDGGGKHIQRKLSAKNEKWKVSEGKAFFVREQDEGYLKVSFFGPFYASYIVFELDKENYEYAFVTGPTKSFLWLLSRTPTVSKELLDSFVIKSKQLGYKTDNLIFVDHE